MYDYNNYKYIKNDGDYIDLTVTENKILKYVLDNKKNISKIEDICLRVYDCFDEYSKKSLRTHIVRLNQKLKGYVQIKNKYRVGYYIEEGRE